MDRFVVREPRIGADFPQANQIVGFGTNNTPVNNNNMIPPESMYLGGYGREYPLQHMGTPGYFSVHQQMSSSNYPLQSTNTNFYPGQAQMTSGIDPRYLAGYSDGNAATYITTGQQVHTDRSSLAHHNFGGDYENRNFVAPDRSKPKPFAAQVNVPVTHKVANKSFDENALKEEPSIKILTRSDKLKALHKAGPRAFSGPVEKVLKWHKALQEIGVLIIYEIVAKCVSVRAGESCAKNLVIRDDSGPAMQVVYYEIDFLLPELKPPCTVRVIGRMMAGTSRLQAFSVRPATGDDVAALPRRAAVAAHHVAKICKEHGLNA
ncbi:hypothetical protein ABMA28_017022 [Loxostege sticticalis]|uniref:Uncharacterized protein n=1 Tax=Loxostege sticticalis TaxID=481309 RepID=A0ABD0T8G0_LOXSC